LAQVSSSVCLFCVVVGAIALTSMLAKLAAVASLASMAVAIELTPANWDEQTSGKTVFIKFLAPW